MTGRVMKMSDGGRIVAVKFSLREWWRGIVMGFVVLGTLIGVVFAGTKVWMGDREMIRQNQAEIGREREQRREDVARLTTILVTLGKKMDRIEAGQNEIGREVSEIRGELRGKK